MGTACLQNGIKPVIHAVGPDCRNAQQRANAKVLLENVVASILQLASDQKLKHIAIPLISSKIFAYPRALSIKGIIDTIAKLSNRYAINVITICDIDPVEDVAEYARKNYATLNVLRYGDSSIVAKKIAIEEAKEEEKEVEPSISGIWNESNVKRNPPTPSPVVNKPPPSAPVVS